MEYPIVDLPVDVIAWTNVTEEILDIYKQACRLKACVFALCMEGSLTVSINLMDVEIRKDDLIVLLPGAIIQFYEQSEDVKICFIGFSSHCMAGMNLIKSMPDSYYRIMRSPVLHLSAQVAGYYRDFMALMTPISMHEKGADQVMAQKVLDLLLYTVSMVLCQGAQPVQTVKSRKEDICHELIQLVIENYTTQRKAQFYADRMGISLQHLSTTVKQITGRNVLEIIANVVIMDAKAKLKSTHMTVQEIAYSLNFPNPSFFGKYFKRHVGMSPQEYREC